LFFFLANLFEGDMRFPNTSPLVVSFFFYQNKSYLNEIQRGVLRRGNSVAWTNGIVPYEISSEYGKNNFHKKFIV